MDVITVTCESCVLAISLCAPALWTDDERASPRLRKQIYHETVVCNERLSKIKSLVSVGDNDSL
jgi:hypothetical protein